MSQQLSAILQTARSDLENLAITHLAEYQQRNDEDLHLLLDLCDESHSLPLDDIEQEGVRIAEANDPIDVRLESIERTADAVGAAIDMHFAGIEQMRLYAREQLRRSRRAYIMSLTRGFQNAINLLKTEENERTHLFQERLRALQNGGKLLRHLPSIFLPCFGGSRQRLFARSHSAHSFYYRIGNLRCSNCRSIILVRFQIVGNIFTFGNNIRNCPFNLRRCLIFPQMPKH